MVPTAPANAAPVASGQPVRHVSGRSVLRDAIRTLIANGLVLLALQIASILMVRMLGVTGRGEVAAAVLVPTIVAYGGWLGLPTATGYLVNAEPALRARTIATARTLALALSIVLGAVSVALSTVVSLPAEARVASIAFATFIPLNLFASVHQAILQADLRSVAFNVVRVAGALLYVLLLAVVGALDLATPTTAVLAQLGGAAISFLLSLRLATSRPWFLLDREIARSLLAFGGRAHLGAMSPVDSLRVDQLILALFLSTYDLGLYVIAMTFVTANRMIGTSVGMVAFPAASRKTLAGNGGNRKLVLGGLIAGTALLTGLAIAFEIAFGRWLLRLLFDVRDDEVYRLLIVLAVGSFFMNVRQICSEVLRGLNRPTIPTWSELVSLVSLGVLAVAFWSHGVIGVAWAVTLSACAATVFVVIAGFRGRESSHVAI